MTRIYLRSYKVRERYREILRLSEDANLSSLRGWYHAPLIRGFAAPSPTKGEGYFLA